MAYLQLFGSPGPAGLRPLELHRQGAELHGVREGRRRGLLGAHDRGDSEGERRLAVLKRGGVPIVSP